MAVITIYIGEEKRKATMADAIMMARDAIGIKSINAEDEGREVPEPSDVLKVDITKSTS